MIEHYPILEEIAKNLVNLKQEFMQDYSGTSHVQEVIPTSHSNLFPIEDKYFVHLHRFAQNNPMYYDCYEKKISGIPCIVYEGDINKYWLNSIQHRDSHAPFSPTWVFSSFVLSFMAKLIGFKQVVDVGSGDGRIAYCAKILNLESYSIEIDDMLVNLQNTISEKTNIRFNPICSNAVCFDYSSLNLTLPAFFIGGLAQMGGLALATGLMDNLLPTKQPFGIVFAGTTSPKYFPDPMSNAGWGTLINKYGLSKINCLTLPSMWTNKEPDDTPYLFTRLDNRNPN